MRIKKKFSVKIIAPIIIMYGSARSPSICAVYEHNYLEFYFNNLRRDVTKAVRANLRLRVTKIIARIKSDYFTVRHMDGARRGQTGGKKGLKESVG